MKCGKNGVYRYQELLQPGKYVRMQFYLGKNVCVWLQ